MDVFAYYSVVYLSHESTKVLRAAIGNNESNWMNDASHHKWVDKPGVELYAMYNGEIQVGWYTSPELPTTANCKPQCCWQSYLIGPVVLPGIAVMYVCSHARLAIRDTPQNTLWLSEKRAEP